MRLAGTLLALGLLGGGGALLGEQSWLATKALLASRLIDRALAAHLEDGEIHRPWSWADTHPIARLEVPRLGVRRTILAGASGPSMAFGPGHLNGSARPNGNGNCVVAGHRDSWFAFLRELRPGDAIDLSSREGHRRYRVVDLSVRSMWDAEVVAPTPGPRLTLVTCHPFGGLRRTARRYVVVCLPAGVERHG
jgi:sortase A